MLYPPNPPNPPLFSKPVYTPLIPNPQQCAACSLKSHFQISFVTYSRLFFHQSYQFLWVISHPALDLLSKTITVCTLETVSGFPINVFQIGQDWYQACWGAEKSRKKVFFRQYFNSLLNSHKKNSFTFAHTLYVTSSVCFCYSTVGNRQSVARNAMMWAFVNSS